MDESNAFTKRHVEEVTAAKRTLLDELNLPPAVKDYIRDNARFLQVSFVLVIGTICAWNYYTYYKVTKDDQAAKQLSQAMLITDMQQKSSALAKIPVDFSSTGSAIWAQLTQAGDYLGQKEYAKALPILQALEKDVRLDNPLFPLLQQLNGVAHELSGDLDMALKYYESLSSLSGFAARGYIDSGRVYELQGQTAKAKDAYEKAHTSNDINPDQRAWIQEKINTI